MNGKTEQDDLDDVDEALRAWVLHFTRKDDHRKADEVTREIAKLAGIRERRRWTSRLRPFMGPGVETFGARHDFTDNNGGWTQETDD